MEEKRKLTPWIAFDNSDWFPMEVVLPMNAHDLKVAFKSSTYSPEDFDAIQHRVCIHLQDKRHNMNVDAKEEIKENERYIIIKRV
jgi:hypothetical protein